MHLPASHFLAVNLPFLFYSRFTPTFLCLPFEIEFLSNRLSRFLSLWSPPISAVLMFTYSLCHPVIMRSSALLFLDFVDCVPQSFPPIFGSPVFFLRQSFSFRCCSPPWIDLLFYIFPLYFLLLCFYYFNSVSLLSSLWLLLLFFRSIPLWDWVQMNVAYWPKVWPRSLAFPRLYHQNHRGPI